MDLILWRHADAADGAPDLERQLTAKGRAQAARVGEWLLRHLPPQFELVASPAARAQQTAQALQMRIRTDPRLAPGASVEAILQAAGWPSSAATVVVGHQPDLGRAAAFLLCGRKPEWHIDKGALWWFTGDPASIRAVVSPDLL
jgi:phosphohistidine phosphatase